MKILRVIASVDPATGGPVAGLRAITPVLNRLGHFSEFVTVDSPDASYLSSCVAYTHALGPGRGRYAYSARFRPWLKKHIRRFDAVIVHGLWQYLGLTIRSVTRTPGSPPYFVYPHGMLDPSLRETYPVKHAKKWLYWQFAERRVLRDARAVFFTCEEERRLASQTFPGYVCNEQVLNYGTASPEGRLENRRAAWAKHLPAVQGKRYFLFLSRIHSKKGLDLLLKAYAEIARQPSADVPDLVVAGPCFDPSYLASLQKIVQSAGITHRIHWCGMLTGDAKWGALTDSEAFILPSYQENFGIAVAESLACGRPVLISDRVNIWRELSSDGAALVEPADEAGTTRLLQRWLSLTSDQRNAMATAARASFAKRFEITRSAENFAEHLVRLSAQGQNPAK